MYDSDKHTSLFWPGIRDEDKSFITLTQVVNVTKCFYSLLTLRHNKLECLFLAIIFSLVWYLQSSQGAYTEWVNISDSTQALALLANI
jgi:hypothetical protein